MKIMWRGHGLAQGYLSKIFLQWPIDDSVFSMDAPWIGQVRPGR